MTFSIRRAARYYLGARHSPSGAPLFRLIPADQLSGQAATRWSLRSGSSGVTLGELQGSM